MASGRHLSQRDKHMRVNGEDRSGFSGALEVALEKAEAFGGLLVGASQGLAMVVGGRAGRLGVRFG